MIECKDCLFLSLCLADTNIIGITEEKMVGYSIQYPKRMFECCSKDPITMIHARNFLFNLKRMYV
jgi:hypothetical protein